MGQVGTNFGEVILHEHLMPESTISRNAKTANHRASTLPFLDVLKFLDGENKIEILDIVVMNNILYVGII